MNFMRKMTIIFFGILTILELLGFFLLGSISQLILFFICLGITLLEFCLYRKDKPVQKKKTWLAGRILLFLILLYISCFASILCPLGIYELKLSYAAAFGSTTEHFPKRVSGMELMEMGFLPSIMQGNGHVYARFEVEDDALLRQLEAQAEGSCEIQFTAADYTTGQIEKDVLEKARRILQDHWSSSSPAPAPDIWIWNSERVNNHSQDHDIRIYIISSNYYTNHIRTSSVVVDWTDHVIEYEGM